MELRLETLVLLAAPMLEDQSQLPSALITELRKFSGNPEPEVISDSDPRKYIHVAAGILNDISTGALKPGCPHATNSRNDSVCQSPPPSRAFGSSLNVTWWSSTATPTGSASADDR